MVDNPILEKIREQKQEEEIITLSSGIRVIIPGMSFFELQEMAINEPDIKPPIFHDPDTGRDIENPNDPAYIAAVQQAKMERGLKVLDSMLIGVKLVDSLPEDDAWVKKLRFKEKRGLVNLNGLNLDDPYEKEYAYKKHEAFLEKDDWDHLSAKIYGIREATNKADAIFPGDEKRDADNGASPQEGSQGS